MKWMKEMDEYNFLMIYDVMLDIKQEINISPDHIIIPLMRNKIRFPQIFPIDGINMRDDYCSGRWKATVFLKKNTIIENFELLKDIIRWEQKLEINLNPDKFKKAFSQVTREYKKRYESKEKSEVLNSFWDLLHPRIVEISKSRFESAHYADSVEATLKEINSIVKTLVKEKINKEFDGADLMDRAFSLQNPIIKLDDLSTETGKDIQKGYMQIFAGTMTGIRNPKAHGNVIIDYKRAIHFLFLASLLMYKIDERKKQKNEEKL